ncbi:zinc transport system substrate-binding protein [Alkalibacillus flavidus]|uniref:Zinc transport system substrate-binding protein n=1 Tax=Alkalibacillus flavidus TaxID=546021 RepID=A0ABV2KVT5_9BACI
MKKLLIVIISIILFLAACGDTNDGNSSNGNTTESPSESKTTENESIGTIVTSIYPLEFIVSEIAGDIIDVETVVPAGADAHTYEPSTKEMINMASSDIFMYVGGGLEVFGETLADTVKDEGVEPFALTNQQDDLFASMEDNDHDGHNHDHDEGEDHTQDNNELDLHFWLDPARMAQAGELILSELTTMYPDQAEQFQSNYESFAEEMNELDQTYEEALSDKSVDILVAHEAFGYWEREYGIEQHGIRGLSSSQNPSQRELQQLFDSFEELDLNHVILEKNRDDSLATTIANEFDFTVYELHSLGSITEEDIEQNNDYIDIMNENLDVLKQTIQ